MFFEKLWKFFGTFQTKLSQEKRKNACSQVVVERIGVVAGVVWMWPVSVIISAPTVS